MSKYTFEITGYGGEYVIGNISKQAYDYFTQNNIDIEEYISDWDGELNIPEECKPFPADAWFECDNVIHAYGAEMSDDSYLTVYDEDGDEIWYGSLDADSDDCVFSTNTVNQVATEDLASGEFLFYGQSIEEGSFFRTEIELDAEFDANLLKFDFVTIDDVPVFQNVYYNGTLLDNDGDTGTSGNGNVFKLIGIN